MQKEWHKNHSGKIDEHTPVLRVCKYVCVYIVKMMLLGEDNENDETDLRSILRKRKNAVHNAWVERDHLFVRSAQRIVQFHLQHYKYFFNNNLGNKMSHK